MKKNRLRFIRCIWHDKVDMLMWLVIIGLFVYSLIVSPYEMSEKFDIGDVSPFLFVIIFYVYYFMYRKFTFWQDRIKMYEHLKDIGEDADEIIKKEDY